MTIEVYRTELDTQASTTASMVDSHLETYNQLTQALASFEASSKELKGKSYDMARSFSSQVFQPLIKGAYLIAESAKSGTNRLPTEYRAQVSDEDLKDWELEEQIQALETSISSCQEQVDLLSKEKGRSDSKELVTYYQELISNNTSAKQILEEKLQKLQAFNSASPSFFAELAELVSAFDTGLSQLDSAWDANTLTYKVPADLTWATTLNHKHELRQLNEGDRAYVNNLQAQYGFDETTALQILKVRNGIDKKFPKMSQENKDYLLLRILGGTVYSGVMWDATAGSLSVPVPEWGGKDIKEIFQDLGLSEGESNQLYYNIRLQHEMSSGEYSNSTDTKKEDLDQYEQFRDSYKNIYGTTEGFDNFWDRKLNDYYGNGSKTDFAHQAITTATNLTDESQLLKDLSGWRGDVTTDAEAKPSMGNDDYKADLDAVNIAKRMKGTGKPYIEVSNEYYQKADKVREKEFLDNEGGYNKISDRVFLSLVPGYKNPTQRPPVSRDAALEYLKNSKDLLPAYKFLVSLKNQENQFE
ncbi:hypothetical protein STRDD11_01252 [Streptococcus sp. DD11]|uniref:hypothetical protein n=1 Tax=Streptococcus sp. DD11 TaxID=1777879 RepID=UPI000797A1D6|nr:hypothetical protein [Streptococcus sp. DD11]KXT83855.1 hypothetical protein STRDD11_01252 [Streptococcus sp. DD11]